MLYLKLTYLGKFFNRSVAYSPYENKKIWRRRWNRKIFHCEIVVDNARVAAETKAYKPIPVITDFTGGDGKDHMREEIERNYYRIKEEVGGIIQRSSAA